MKKLLEKVTSVETLIAQIQDNFLKNLFTL
jgi:hypothetical protein